MPSGKRIKDQHSNNWFVLVGEGDNIQNSCYNYIYFRYSPYFIDFYWNILTLQYHVSFCCTMNESAVCVHISLPLGPDDFGCFLPSLIWQLNLEP